MHFVCIYKWNCEYNIKDWPLLACRSLITKSLQYLAPGAKVKIIRNSSYLRHFNPPIPPPPLPFSWMHVFEISDNKSGITARGVSDYWLHLKMKIEIQTWDSLTCQSKGYHGTYVTVNAWEPFENNCLSIITWFYYCNKKKTYCIFQESKTSCLKCSILYNLKIQFLSKW